MAKREVLIVNAYIIPVQRSIDTLKSLRDRCVEIRILTNLPASHGVPAVNSHYKQWRRQIRESTAGLYELRRDAAIQAQVAETPPKRAEFMGLHSKGMVVDRRLLFIGSMNFDPRSGQLNTEMGLFVDSPDLAEALAQGILRDMRPENSWRVEIEADGTVTWTNDRETVKQQPARGFMQRVEDVIFMMFPRDLC